MYRFLPGLLPRTMAHLTTLVVLFGTCFLVDGGKSWRPFILVAGLCLLLGASAFATCLLPNRWRSLWILAHLTLVLVLLATALSYALYILQPEHARVDGFRAAAQTDLAEAAAFIAANVTSAQVVFVAFSLVAIPLTFPWTRMRLHPEPARVLLVTLAIATGGVASAVGAQGTVEPIAILMRNYRAEMEEFRKTALERQVSPIQASSTLDEGTIIMIQGESLSRHHMGLYGYFRETTPKLSARQDLAVFRDVISPHSHTPNVLTLSLTTAGTDPTKKFSRAEDILSVANAAGLKTYWFSNQNEFGVWDNPVSILAKTAAVSRFFTTTTGEAYNRQIKDHQMLPAVQAAMAERGPKLIILHLFGNHWPYCDNYPPEFRFFTGRLGERLLGKAPNTKPEQHTNCYDNSVRYVDSIIDTVLQAAAAQKSPTAVLFQSDHGEAPLLGTGHNSAEHSAYHVEIPMLLWANMSYKAKHAQIWSTALANQNKSYTTAKLFHSLAHLMQITSSVVDLQQSIFSTDYTAAPRTTLDGWITYDSWGETSDTLENTRHFLAALKEGRPLVWAHRVNSIGKLLEAKRYFDGVEMDVVFDPAADEFFVYHPPDPNMGLALEEALDVLRDRPDIRLWLDWKNSEPDLMEAAVKRLDELNRAYSIAGRALVETGSDKVFEGIGTLSAAGFHHGYYIPATRIAECLRRCSRDELAALADELKKTIDDLGVAAITYDWDLRPFVQEWLEPFVVSRSLRQYSWQLSITSSQRPAAAEELWDRMRQVPGLGGMLIPFPSAFDN